ncbi:AI-2E family transporter [Flavobacterium sp. xlx-214]|uniref:AI-2E family transporter n=1 Tax=unclassified Flavobacterium TaxID=196869 RepID=UPI0013D07B41|nr:MULTISPECIES: AI-2E family transporter [unclassified Flavobacterium]MBA5793571.1 AI-2E family transporter [Flavobacterium sp. xlx-221]QMI84501.1 AI-2E family transporter [Flavobacterium sp. xlx-214]
MENKEVENQPKMEPHEVNSGQVPFVIRLTCVLLSIIAIVYIAIVGKAVLVPLVMGFLIAMLLLPLSNFQERKLKFPRIVSSLVSPILFTLVVLGVFYFIGTQMAQFTEDLPEFKQQMEHLFHEIQVFVYNKFGVSEQEQLQYITKNAGEVLKKGSGVVGTAVSSVTSMLASSMFVFLGIFFFLLYRSHLVKFIIWCFPPKDQSKVKDVVSEIQSIIKQYIFGLMIQVVAVSVLMFIAYSIIGIKYAVLFAVLCGVLNLIPYIGIFTATVLAAVVTLATGEPIQALWVIVAVVVVNSIDGNIITPKIIGSKVSLNSFVVLFGIVIAESIWGVAGMFLAIPILAIFKIIFDNVEGMRPYGFVLGEDSAPTPLFEKYYNKYIYRIKPKDADLPRALQTEEQNHQEGEKDKNETE